MFEKLLEDVDAKVVLQDEAMKLDDLGIVVAGIAGRFPNAESVSEFEDCLLRGVDMMTDNDSSRFECGLWNLPSRAGRLKDISKFDNEFFNILSEDANQIDHQVRILYEVVYEAILDAGINPSELRGSNTGVFIGNHCYEFDSEQVYNLDGRAIGYLGQHAAAIAQYFNLRGTITSYDTACASSSTALCAAVEAIGCGTIEQAIVASANIPINPVINEAFLDLQMLSPTGYSRYLDSRADGYARSEACVAILLQRKPVALRNYCSILSIGTNADGYKEEGITFPSVDGQETLIRNTNRAAGISTNHVEYIEAHGTGTPAGDPVECEAITNVYFEKDETGLRYKRKIGPLLTGSCKTNMGHPEGASGLCALTKVAMMLENEIIYKMLHYDKPNANIKSLVDGRIEPVTESRKLRAKIVPISNYGFGGSNAHVIVRSNERPAIRSAEHLSLTEKFEPRLIVMFGRSENLLNTFFDSLLDEQSRHTRNCLTDDFLSLLDSINKTSIDRLMNYRGYMIVDRRSSSNQRQVARSIKHCNYQMSPWSHVQDVKPPVCNLIFPGLGCQWPGMAAGLTDYRPFWSTIERLSRFVREFDDQVDLSKLLTSASKQELNKSMCNTSVSIVAYQIALTNIVRDQLQVNNLGSIVGHSLGEVVSAYAAGILDERQTVLLGYQIGRSLDELKHVITGKMIALNVSEQQADELVKDYSTLRVSCVNGPQSVTVSGRTGEVDHFCETLRANTNIYVVRIESLSMVMHNESIFNKEIKNKLRASLLKVLSPEYNYKQNSLMKWHSCIAAPSDWNICNEANAEYFANMICKKVDFYASLRQLEDDSIALELGPSGIFGGQLHSIPLSSPIKNAVERTNKFRYAKLMSRPKAGNHDDDLVLRLVRGIGDLYLIGTTFKNLTSFHHYQIAEKGKKNSVIYPVKRQTPSLSSLFKWKKETDFFVPRHPMQFTQISTNNQINIDIANIQGKYLCDHQIEGRILFPATGYLLLIWQFICRIKYDVNADFKISDWQYLAVEFKNVRFLRAVILSSDEISRLEMTLNDGTGQFEVVESGSVVVQGYIRILDSSGSGILYDQTREFIKCEELDCDQMKSNDVYKRFRVKGYDYGQYFQNIISSSADGRYSRIKYNSYFDSFTDSMLQTLILSTKQNTSTDALFLPVGIDYVRIQPKEILKKLEQTNTPFTMDQTFVKNDPSCVDLKLEEDSSSASSDAFDVYCDPTTGVIISDGIEMRGVKLTLAPRRADNQRVLLESYQFIEDCEDPIEDKNLEKLNDDIREYTQICNSMSASLLAKLCHRRCSQLKGLDYDYNQHLNLIDEDSEQFEAMYMRKYLFSIYKPSGEDQKIDITVNRDRRLMSILDVLLKEESLTEIVKDILSEIGTHLLYDLTESSSKRERMFRSLLETVVENNCSSKSTIGVLEINRDDFSMKDVLKNTLRIVDSSISMNYILSQPEGNLEHVPGASSNIDDEIISNFEEIGKNGQHTEMDLVIKKDFSWVGALRESVKPAKILEILRCLANFVKPDGFIMISLRQSMTFAERLVILLQKKSNYFDRANRQDGNERLGLIITELNRINDQLKLRCNAFISHAEQANLTLISKKSDSNGCTWLLLRERKERFVTVNKHDCEITKPKVIRVTHNNKENISIWLEEFKANFTNVKEDDKQEGKKLELDSLVEDHNKKPSTVWLCAVQTRQQSVSGLIGMMQALRKELGSERLRCFYDSFTFKHCDEPISVHQIEQSDKFRQAMERDLIWNCADSDGKFGSFRHFTINDYFNYDECLCANNWVGEKKLHQSAVPEAQHEQYAFVNYAKRGDLSSFTWFESPIKFLPDTDRENICTVAYSALNFKDIMLATGKLALDAIPLKQATQDCVIGFEFSGKNCENERVMGMMSSRAIATHVHCPKDASFIIKVPDWLSLAEAATIPVVYATAIMALICRGKMQRGEAILIHAGSGGVGQAAIRLAAHYGLTVYTTVGSDQKRKFLLEEFSDCLSEERIFSSRDCQFEEKIMHMTHGSGVDLVLNSLADEKLQASVRCLADGGRFLEIGKYDMSVDNQLELNKLDTNKTFHGISLDKLFEGKESTYTFLNQMNLVLRTLSDGLKRGYVKPIKHMIFKSDQIEEAFRYMATGKHIGKVLIEINPTVDYLAQTEIVHRPRIVPRFQLSSEKSYIVTGGLGGFGLELVKWLVQEGALYIVITSRKGVLTSYQRMTLDQLSSNEKVKILVVDKQAADSTCFEGVNSLCGMALDLCPKRQIGGVFHLAMVLKDSLIENMTADDFVRVCQPKVDTFVHLDQVTRETGLNIKYFVAFSSVTSGKGNAGQANYAYANSCLERICERRRASGLHGLAIQWGAIGDVGVAFENLGGNDVIIGNMIPQRIPSCLTILSKVLCAPFPVCSSIVPAETSIESNSEGVDLVAAVMNVLGVKDRSVLTSEVTLGELGLDSLMAVEIRQYIKREHDVTLDFQETRSLTVGKIRELEKSSKSTSKQISSDRQTSSTTDSLKVIKKVENYGKQNKDSSKTSLLETDYSLYISKSFVSILPPIKLPQEKFCRLNANFSESERPIFFIPPFHGHFKELKLVCSTIRRPCIGINWTKSFSNAIKIDQLVSIYSNILTNTDWKNELGFDCSPDERVVDIIGYSFGSMVSFELMVSIQNSSLNVQSASLKPGQLVMLDCSPRQLEIASMQSLHVAGNDFDSLEKKVDQLLLIYVNAHLNDKKVKVDTVQLGKDLSACPIKTKSNRASKFLYDAIKDQLVPEPGLVDRIEDAMDAFWARFIIMESYVTTKSLFLNGDCLLIRAEETFIKLPQELLNEHDNDLGLKDLVQGKVHSFKLKGEHATFLDDNFKLVGEIITQHLNFSASTIE